MQMEKGTMEIIIGKNNVKYVQEVPSIVFEIGKGDKIIEGVIGKVSTIQWFKNLLKYSINSLWGAAIFWVFIGSLYSFIEYGEAIYGYLSIICAIADTLFAIYVLLKTKHEFKTRPLTIDDIIKVAETGGELEIHNPGDIFEYKYKVKIPKCITALAGRYKNRIEIPLYDPELQKIIEKVENQSRVSRTP